jgi:quinoprotein glucose dehydrogenase
MRVALAVLAPALFGIGCGLAACSGVPWCDRAAVRALGDARCVTDWPVYGGDAGARRYSALTQITPSNVARLQPAWRYETSEPGESQTNPLVIGRVLYAYTPGLKLIALDAATGRLLWSFDAGVHGSGPDRGLAWWSDGRERRLLAGVMHTLYALDPATGRPIPSFGDHGHIDLRDGLLGDARSSYVSLTSPGMVYQDLVIVGFRTSEVKPAPPADIRAFDVHTGALRWSFHTIPRPGEFGYDTWPAEAWRRSGSANNWAGFALDARRGILYAPTGSAVDDFYGADRVGNNLFADTLLALDARTGARLWHFQETHHDIWDRDLPAQPALLTVTHAGRRVDAIAQTSKQGYVFLFDRVTGAPLFPIVEEPHPASDVPGEVTAPTQPRPLAPEPFARQRLTEDLLTDRTAQAHAWALQAFRALASDGQFVPLHVGTPTVVFPGFDGGAEWGGPAVDPVQGILYVNANDVAWTGMLLPTRTGASPAETFYQQQCASCHGVDRAGSPPAFPSLQGIGARLSQDQISQVLREGRGRMPPFPALSGDALTGLLQLLRAPVADSAATQQPNAPPGPQTAPAPYHFTGYQKFLDPDGYPAVLPPWGTLSAIDLNTGAYRWRVPLGEYPELRAQGRTGTGSENYGGPILTASGVLFIGATVYDHKLRAFDSSDGRLLWEAELPYAGTATPATYLVDGRQYVVIATSNARNRKAPQGGAYVAFALPGGR